VIATVASRINLRGRRALVTGACGGIGRVIVNTLAELGADIILVDRPESDLEKTAQSLRTAWGVQATCFLCDLELEAQRRNLIENVNSSEDGLAVLINNAAFVGTSTIEGWAVPFADQSITAWRRALEVNLTAVFELCQGLHAVMRRTDGASIINVGSIYGLLGPDYSLYSGTEMANPAAYGASKGGLIQLTRWLATTMAPEVRVNSLSPGGVLRGQPEAFVQRYSQRTPLGRMATEEDFQGAIAYLASDLSSYVTGQNLSVDGGWGIW
jgi:NAD(P)-dependent dehydrogenase (short-subunit alcohol dehydrogenase family)